MQKKTITFGGRTIGPGNPVFIIAEAGVNHNGDKTLAKKLIDAATLAGADAVKFQTFDPDTLVTKEAKKADYQDKNEHTEGGGESQYEMLKRLQLPREMHTELKAYAEQKGIMFLSTPFSLSDAQFLKELGVVAFKIGSSDTDNLPFLKTIATWGLPIMLSTGMSDLALVRKSVEAIQSTGNQKLVVLHCTTSYPAPLAQVNLRARQTLAQELGVLVGFSDHTEGIVAPVLSVALGATVIEKHLTLDKEMSGPDHKASLTPHEFAEMVRAVREAESALGTGEKNLFGSEREIAKVARKSLVVARAVKKGEVFTAQNLTTKRPGTGLPPAMYDTVMGAKALRDIPTDTLITENDYGA